MAWVVDEVAKSGPGVGLTTGSEGQPTPYLNIGGAAGTGEGVGAVGPAPAGGWVVDTPAPKRTAGDEFLRQLGLTGRAVGTGLPAIPLMLGDAANALVNLGIGGANAMGADLPKLPTASGAFQNIMTQAGLPQPENLQERAVQAGGAALSGAGLMGSLAKSLSAVPELPQLLPQIADVMAQGPKMQALGAGAASAATDYAKDQGVKNPLALLGIALATSAVPGTGSSIATRTGTGLKAIAMDPFTTTGRDLIAGSLLRRLATNPDAAAAAMESATPLVPGSMPTMAQVSKDAGLISNERPMLTALGKDDLLKERLSQQNAARNQALDSIIMAPSPPKMDAQGRIIPPVRGTPGNERGTVGYATAKRDATLEQEMRPAFRNADSARDVTDTFGGNKAAPGSGYADVSPVFRTIDAIRKTPSLQGRQDVQDALKWAQARLSQPNIDLENPEVLYGIRKDLADVRNGVYDSAKSKPSLASGQLDKIITSLDGVIERAAPGFSRYMGLYAKRSKALNQTESIENLRAGARGQISDPLTGKPILTMGNFGQRVRKAVASGALGRGPGNGNLSPSQIRIIVNVVDDIDRGAAASAATIREPGSNTFKNLTVANALGRFFGKNFPDSAAGQHIQSWLRPLQWMAEMPDDRIAEILTAAVLDPKLAARLMRKANKYEIESLARELGSRVANQATGGATYGEKK